MANVVIGTAVSLGLGMLSRALTPTKYVYNQRETGKLDDISTRKAGMGWSLDRHYGRTIVKSCPIFWALPKIDRPETVSTTERTGGGKGGGGGSVTTTETTEHRYFGTFAFAIGDGYPNGVGAIVKIKFNDEVWYNTQGETDETSQVNDYRLNENLEIKTGAVSQGPSNIIQQYEDFDRIHFAGLAYCVVQDLPLAQFGNELPGQIDVELFGIAEIGDNVSLVIRDAMHQVGLQPAIDYRSIGIEKKLIGATLKQDGSSVKSFLDDIFQIHFLISYLDNEGLICVNEEELGNVVSGQVSISYADLGSGEPTDDIGAPYTETIVSEKELPSEVSLSFINAEDGYSGGTESWMRPIAKQHRPQSLSSSLVLTPGKAREFCWRYLNLVYDQKSRYKFKVGPSVGLQLFSGQLISVSLAPGDPAATFQINQVNIGADLTAEVDATLFNGEAFTGVPVITRSRCQIYNGQPIELQPNITAPPSVRADDVLLVEGTGYTVNYGTGVITLIGVENGVRVCVDYQSEVNDNIDDYRPEDEFLFFGEPVATILDIHRVNNSDPPCVYLAITPDPAYDAVGDTGIFASVNGSPFTQVGTAISATTTGELTSSLVLSDPLLVVDGIDPLGTATLILDRGFLDPLTDAQFANNQLILLVGEEQISVKDVTLTAPLTYTIGNFKRGHNGTIISDHSIGEDVTVLRGVGQVIRLNGSADLIDKDLSIKLVPRGFSIDDIATVTTITVRGNYFRPYRPSDLYSVKDQSGNITLVWQGNNTGLIDLVPFEFDVDIYNGATVVRTITVTQESLVYTVDQQIEDFGSIQSTITVGIFQLSQEYGLAAGVNTDRGYELKDTITPVLGALLPVVDGFSPAQGSEGTAISIYGSGFTGTLSAAIDGTDIDDFLVVSDTEITGTVATGTETGKVGVTNAIGTGLSLLDFVIIEDIDTSDFMLKSVYDIDEDDIVDVSASIDGIESAGNNKYYGTDSDGEPGFYDLPTSAEWGQITGTLSNQTDLQSVLVRTRIYTYIVGNVTAPVIGSTITVTVAENYGFAPGVPVCLFRTNTVGVGGSGYAQLNCTSVSGNTLTLVAEVIGKRTESDFLDGDIIAPIVENTVGVYGGIPEGLQFTDDVLPNQYYGSDNDNILGFYDFPVPSPGIETGLGDMLKSVYDTDNDGIVDKSESIDGIVSAGNSKYYGTNGSGSPGFYDLPTSSEWGQITGTLANQTDLQDVLVRTRVLSFITNTVNIPGVGNTVNVQIEDNYGLVPGIPLCLFSLNPVNGANNYAQVWCTAVSGDGLTLTVEIQAIGRIACYEFVPGDVIAVITEATVGIYGGLMPPLQNGDWKKNYGSAFIASPTVSVIPLFTAPIYTVIKQIRGLRVSAGTATLSIQIDGVSVTGLNNIAVNTTAQTINATALDIAEVGDRVTVNITAVSGAQNLEFTLMAEVG